MPRTRPTAALLLLLALLPPSSAVRADDDEDHERARTAVLRGEALPLDQILARLPLRDGERLLEAEFEREDGRWVYELEFIGADGRVRELEVDALSAAILEDD
ncbi:PepSY domain-containing protein [Silanimonas algicola]